MRAASRAAPSSRRALLQGAGAAGAATMLSACGRASRPKVHQIPQRARSADVEILNRALDLEHETIAAYTAGIPLLGGPVLEAAKRFLDQELSHAGELAGLIKQAGGKAPKPPSSYALGRPHGPADIVSLLHALERAQLANYFQVIPSLSPGPVRAAVAAVLANDAQHVAVLRPALGLEPVPAAFVTGRE